MMKHVLFLSALSAAALLFSACNTSYPPLYYQQIYTLKGVRTDAHALFDRGTTLPASGFRTPLQILYLRHPEIAGKMPDNTCRLGWFFRQKDNFRTMGEAMADLCNHAAWFVLNFIPAKEQTPYARRIAALMLDGEERDALKLLAELRAKAVPGGIIRVKERFYDEDKNGVPSQITEYYIGTRHGITNPKTGLHRTFHPNGMLAEEAFYLDNRPTGYEFRYDMEGNIVSIRFFGKNKTEKTAVCPLYQNKTSAGKTE